MESGPTAGSLAASFVGACSPPPSVFRLSSPATPAAASALDTSDPTPPLTRSKARSVIAGLLPGRAPNSAERSCIKLGTFAALSADDGPCYKEVDSSLDVSGALAEANQQLAVTGRSVFPCSGTASYACHTACFSVLWGGGGGAGNHLNKYICSRHPTHALPLTWRKDHPGQGPSDPAANAVCTACFKENFGLGEGGTGYNERFEITTPDQRGRAYFLGDLAHPAADGSTDLEAICSDGYGTWCAEVPGRLRGFKQLARDVQLAVLALACDAWQAGEIMDDQLNDDLVATATARCNLVSRRADSAHYGDTPRTPVGLGLPVDGGDSRAPDHLVAAADRAGQTLSALGAPEPVASSSIAGPRKSFSDTSPKPFSAKGIEDAGTTSTLPEHSLFVPKFAGALRARAAADEMMADPGARSNAYVMDDECEANENDTTVIATLSAEARSRQKILRLSEPDRVAMAASLRAHSAKVPASPGSTHSSSAATLQVHTQMETHDAMAPPSAEVRPGNGGGARASGGTACEEGTGDEDGSADDLAAHPFNLDFGDGDAVHDRARPTTGRNGLPRAPSHLYNGESITALQYAQACTIGGDAGRLGLGHDQMVAAVERGMPALVRDLVATYGLSAENHVWRESLCASDVATTFIITATAIAAACGPGAGLVVALTAGHLMIAAAPRGQRAEAAELSILGRVLGRHPRDTFFAEADWFDELNPCERVVLQRFAAELSIHVLHVACTCSADESRQPIWPRGGAPTEIFAAIAGGLSRTGAAALAVPDKAADPSTLCPAWAAVLSAPLFTKNNVHITEQRFEQLRAALAPAQTVYPPAGEVPAVAVGDAALAPPAPPLAAARLYRLAQPALLAQLLRVLADSSDGRRVLEDPVRQRDHFPLAAPQDASGDQEGTPFRTWLDRTLPAGDPGGASAGTLAQRALLTAVWARAFTQLIGGAGSDPNLALHASQDPHLGQLLEHARSAHNMADVPIRLADFGAAFLLSRETGQERMMMSWTQLQLKYSSLLSTLTVRWLEDGLDGGVDSYRTSASAGGSGPAAPHPYPATALAVSPRALHTGEDRRRELKRCIWHVALTRSAAEAADEAPLQDALTARAAACGSGICDVICSAAETAQLSDYFAEQAAALSFTGERAAKLGTEEGTANWFAQRVLAAFYRGSVDGTLSGDAIPSGLLLQVRAWTAFASAAMVRVCETLGLGGRVTRTPFLQQWGEHEPSSVSTSLALMAWDLYALLVEADRLWPGLGGRAALATSQVPADNATRGEAPFSTPAGLATQAGASLTGDVWMVVGRQAVSAVEADRHHDSWASQGNEGEDACGDVLDRFAGEAVVPLLIAAGEQLLELTTPIARGVAALIQCRNLGTEQQDRLISDLRGPEGTAGNRVLRGAAGLMLRQIHQVARDWDHKEPPTAHGACDTCDDDELSELISPPALRKEGPGHDQFLTLLKCLTAAQVIVAGGAREDRYLAEDLHTVAPLTRQALAMLAFCDRSTILIRAFRRRQGETVQTDLGTARDTAVASAAVIRAIASARDAADAQAEAAMENGEQWAAPGLLDAESFLATYGGQHHLWAGADGGLVGASVRHVFRDDWRLAGQALKELQRAHDMFGGGAAPPPATANRQGPLAAARSAPAAAAGGGAAAPVATAAAEGGAASPTPAAAPPPPANPFTGLGEGSPPPHAVAVEFRVWVDGCEYGLEICHKDRRKDIVGGVVGARMHGVTEEESVLRHVDQALRREAGWLEAPLRQMTMCCLYDFAQGTVSSPKGLHLYFLGITLACLPVVTYGTWVPASEKRSAYAANFAQRHTAGGHKLSALYTYNALQALAIRNPSARNGGRANEPARGQLNTPQPQLTTTGAPPPLSSAAPPPAAAPAVAGSVRPVNSHSPPDEVFCYWTSKAVGWTKDQEEQQDQLACDQGNQVLSSVCESVTEAESWVADRRAPTAAHWFGLISVAPGCEEGHATTSWALAHALTSGIAYGQSLKTTDRAGADAWLATTVPCLSLTLSRLTNLAKCRSRSGKAPRWALARLREQRGEEVASHHTASEPQPVAMENGRYYWMDGQPPPARGPAPTAPDALTPPAPAATPASGAYNQDIRALEHQLAALRERARREGVEQEGHHELRHLERQAGSLHATADAPPTRGTVHVVVEADPARVKVEGYDEDEKRRAGAHLDAPPQPLQERIPVALPVAQPLAKTALVSGTGPPADAGAQAKVDALDAFGMQVADDTGLAEGGVSFNLSTSAIVAPEAEPEGGAAAAHIAAAAAASALAAQAAAAARAATAAARAAVAATLTGAASTPPAPLHSAPPPPLFAIAGGALSVVASNNSRLSGDTFPHDATHSVICGTLSLSSTAQEIVAACGTEIGNVIGIADKAKGNSDAVRVSTFEDTDPEDALLSLLSGDGQAAKKPTRNRLGPANQMNQWSHFLSCLPADSAKMTAHMKNVLLASSLAIDVTHTALAHAFGCGSAMANTGSAVQYYEHSYDFMTKFVAKCVGWQHEGQSPETVHACAAAVCASVVRVVSTTPRPTERRAAVRAAVRMAAQFDHLISKDFLIPSVEAVRGENATLDNAKALRALEARVTSLANGHVRSDRDAADAKAAAKDAQAEARLARAALAVRQPLPRAPQPQPVRPPPPAAPAAARSPAPAPAPAPRAAKVVAPGRARERLAPEDYRKLMREKDADRAREQAAIAQKVGGLTDEQRGAIEQQLIAKANEAADAARAAREAARE